MARKLQITISGNTQGSRVRYWVSSLGLYAIVLCTLFLAQALTLGFLPIWGALHIGPVPLQPVVFIGSSLWLAHRYVQINPHA